jgi:hypothetical protein
MAKKNQHYSNNQKKHQTNPRDIVSAYKDNVAFKGPVTIAPKVLTNLILLKKRI